MQVAALCGGELLGGAVGSGRISLTPGALTSGNHTADTLTAGSCMLLAQARIPGGCQDPCLPQSEPDRHLTNPPEPHPCIHVMLLLIIFLGC